VNGKAVKPLVYKKGTLGFGVTFFHWEKIMTKPANILSLLGALTGLNTLTKGERQSCETLGL
jgi:hypothetical protein